MVVCTYFLLAACGSTGNQKIGAMDKAQMNDMLANQIKTKQQARDLLGDPNDVDVTSGGHEKWIYTYTRAKSKPQNFIPVVNLFSRGTNDKHKKIILVFDQKGDVTYATATESSGETHLGIAG